MGGNGCPVARVGGGGGAGGGCSAVSCAISVLGDSLFIGGTTSCLEPNFVGIPFGWPFLSEVVAGLLFPQPIIFK